MTKTLLYDLDVLGLTPDNLEGLALGPELPDGGQTVVVASDNNFNLAAFTQFLSPSSSEPVGAVASGANLRGRVGGDG